LDKNLTKIIGHRGAKGLAQENTLVSLKKALEYGIDEIEFDVRVTKDDVPVLAHDDAIYSLSGKKFSVRGHTLAEINQFTSGISTLQEALEMVDKRVKLLIEVKPRVPVAPIINIVKKMLTNGWHPEDLSFCSFSQRTLLALQKALPQIKKVVNEDYSVLIGMYRARQLGTKHISMAQQYLWSAPVALLKKRGYELYSYTLNNPQKAQRLVRHGLAGIITDHPERYTSVIEPPSTDKK
jgi:glycerophosphoryl diester phosphodiesterase